MDYMWTVDGEIIGKGRPRVTTRGGHAHAYTPKRTVDYERHIRECFLNAYGVFPDLIEYPIEMNLCVMHKIPDSTPKKNRKMLEDNVTPPVKKSDLDNIIKIASDGICGYLIKDDIQIVRILAFKRWAKEPKIVIMIKEYKA